METYLFFLLLGALAGFSAGLFGVGGGVIVVPALILGFLSQGFSPQVLTHMAVATSLAAMIITAASSAYAHHVRGGVRWSIVIWLACGVVIGSVLGVAGSLELKGSLIQIAFAIFLLVIGGRVLLNRKPVNVRPLPSSLKLGGTGLAIGAVSMVFGIGGGSMTVPFLLRYGVEPKDAVGTSAALGFPIALLGAALYAVGDSGNALLPEYTVGYIYLPAFIGLVLLGVPFARLGAAVAHSLPEHILKKTFALFVIVMAFVLLLRNINI